jgi:hypothetical protein
LVVVDIEKRRMPHAVPPLVKRLAADGRFLAGAPTHGRLTSMQSLVVDTNSVIKKLEQRGFSRAQAEGITEALKELDASSLATKTDLKDLEIRLYKFFAGVLIHYPLSA